MHQIQIPLSVPPPRQKNEKSPTESEEKECQIPTAPPRNKKKAVNEIECEKIQVDFNEASGGGKKKKLLVATIILLAAVILMIEFTKPGMYVRTKFY